MNDEIMLLSAFRSMDDEHKRHMLLAMKAVASDYPARPASHLRLVASRPVEPESLGQRAGD